MHYIEVLTRSIFSERAPRKGKEIIRVESASRIMYTYNNSNTRFKLPKRQELVRVFKRNEDSPGKTQENQRRNMYLYDQSNTHVKRLAVVKAKGPHGAGSSFVYSKQRLEYLVTLKLNFLRDMKLVRVL